MKKILLPILALALVFMATLVTATGPGDRPPKGLHYDVNFVTKLSYTESLFNDTFELGLDKWEHVSGTWGIVTEVLPDNTTNDVCSITGGSYVGGVVATTGSVSWTDYSLEFDVKKVSGNYFNVVFRYTDLNNHYLLEPSADSIHIALFKKVGGGGYQELTAIRPLQDTEQGTWYHYRIVVQDTSIKVYVDGVIMFDVVDGSLPAGKIGIGAYSGSTAYFDNVRVMGVNPKEILIPLNGTGYVQWTFGFDFRVVDNDANVNDGDNAIVQFPWEMDMYVWWLSARGKPGTMEVNEITGDGHTTWVRSTRAPTWTQWPGTYSWTGGVNGHTASLVNSGVTNLGLRVYPNQ